MTESEAENILKNYREFSKKTGKEYRYIILKSLGNNTFLCRAKCAEGEVSGNTLKMCVFDNGDVLPIPR